MKISIINKKSIKKYIFTKILIENTQLEYSNILTF